MRSRPSIDVTQMATAGVWSERSTCDRAQVGAVISLGGRTIGTGYNGAPAGMDHCVHELGYMPKIQDFHAVANLVTPQPVLTRQKADLGCRVAIHAETNAIAYAARHGVSVQGSTIYVTLSPCYTCAQLIIAAGLIRVVFDKEYRDPSGIELLRLAGLTVESMHG